MQTNFKKHILKYENELLNSVIPFWEKHCLDEKDGGYFTFLDRDGSVYDTEKYMWMQWRIVYMFAVLYMSKYKQDKWLDIANHGFDFLTRYGKDENGNYYFALNKKGVPSIAPYNIFSECFAVMGSAALYNATGKQIYKQEAKSAMDNYIRRIDNPKGQWEKSFQGRKKRISLGHYMMLANIGYIMSEYLSERKYQNYILQAVDLILNKFWNEEFKVLFENINTDYTFDMNSCDGRMLIPGHGLESLWFVLQYAEKTGNEELIVKTCKMIKEILDFGWDRKNGGIFYFMDVLDKPHVELQNRMKLWWVHNEASIAVLYAYYLTGDTGFLRWFKKIDKWMWKRFPDKKYDEWFGYLDEYGRVTHRLKGGKWKTFFHLPRYLLMNTELMKKCS
jgi:N-acylglucosamine 2-epimerase